MHTTWAGSYARRGKWVFDAYIFRLLFPFLLHRFDCRKKQNERTKVTNEIISNSSFVSSSAFRHSLLAFYFFFQFHDSRSLFGNHEYLCMQHTFMLTHARMYRFHMDLHLSLSGGNFFIFTWIFYWRCLQCSMPTHWLFVIRLVSTILPLDWRRHNRQPVLLLFYDCSWWQTRSVVDGKTGSDTQTHTLSLWHSLTNSLFGRVHLFVLCMSMPRRGTCFLLCHPNVGMFAAWKTVHIKYSFVVKLYSDTRHTKCRARR